MSSPSTATIASVIGTTSENAATPTIGTSTRRISSVAYADDERLSDANTASAVGFPRRSCSRSSVGSAGPRSLRLTRKPRSSWGSSTYGAGDRAAAPVVAPLGCGSVNMLPVNRARPSRSRKGAAGWPQNVVKMGAVRWSWQREPTPVVGVTLGALLVAITTLAMIPLRDNMSLATPALVLVLPVVASGFAGGRVAALIVALGAALAYNLAFIPPYGSPNIDVVEDVTAVLVLGVVGLAVGTLVAREAERRRVAEQRAAALAVLNEQYEVVQAEREQLLEETTRLAVLEQVDAQRAALLRSVSHDLRTPLAAIKAVASDLRAQIDYDEATREDLLDLVIEETERLDRIVGNLLSMSRIEAGALQPERQAVALEELGAACVRRLTPVFKRARVRVETSFPDDLPLADADYSQLDQVATNLLENAARYAPSGSVVRIGGKALGRDRVQLWVEDEGPGVPGHERQRAFAPFERGPGSTGTGVGLAICRAIVEAHGGAIAVEDGRGGGARFVVTLPVRRA